MGVAIVKSQRVPMLDASTLDDRTRPVVEPAEWLAKRLRRSHSSMGVARLDHTLLVTLEPWGLYPGDQRFMGSY